MAKRKMIHLLSALEWILRRRQVFKDARCYDGAKIAEACRDLFWS
jgi:hypothetical protein